MRSVDKRPLPAFALASVLGLSACEENSNLYDTRQIYIYASSQYYDHDTRKPLNARYFLLYKFDGFPATMDNGGDHDNLRLRSSITAPKGHCLRLYSYEGNMEDHQNGFYSFGPDIPQEIDESGGMILEITQVYGDIPGTFHDILEANVKNGITVSSPDKSLYIDERTFSFNLNGPKTIYSDYTTAHSYDEGTFHDVPYEQIWAQLQTAERWRSMAIENSDVCQNFALRPSSLMTIG